MVEVEVILSVAQVALLACLVHLFNKANRLVATDPKEVEPVISDEKFYTLAQVADLLGLHPMTIRRHIRSGKLAAYKVGLDGRFRVAGEDLRAFIGSRSAGVRQ